MSRRKQVNNGTPPQLHVQGPQNSRSKGHVLKSELRMLSISEARNGHEDAVLMSLCAEEQENLQ